MKTLTKMAALAVIGISGLTGCAQIDSMASSAHDTLKGQTGQSTTSGQQANMPNMPSELNTEPNKRAHDYYQELGAATFDKDCDGAIRYTGEINNSGQLGTACGMLTGLNNGKRHKLTTDPAGWGHNKQVQLTRRDGSHYNGWFYDRSHLIADDLQGAPIYENLITGAKTQNIGSNQGGMRYPEGLATDCIKKGGKVQYAATPKYQGDEIIPRYVEVNIKSTTCNIDKKIAVFNDSEGHTINYMTGEFK